MASQGLSVLSGQEMGLASAEALGQGPEGVEVENRESQSTALRPARGNRQTVPGCTTVHNLDSLSGGGEDISGAVDHAEHERYLRSLPRRRAGVRPKGTVAGAAGAGSGSGGLIDASACGPANESGVPAAPPGDLQMKRGSVTCASRSANTRFNTRSENANWILVCRLGQRPGPACFASMASVCAIEMP